MADQNTSVQTLKDAFKRFVAERQWEPFHSPKNLAMGLAVEVAELMEHFLWMDNNESEKAMHDPEKRSQVADEVADVAGYVLCMCNALDFDLTTIVETKLQKNAEKYPSEQYRGRYKI